MLTVIGLRFRVQCLRVFEVRDLGLSIEDFEFRALGFRVQDIQALWFKV